MEQTKSKFSVKDLSLYYGDFKALKNINMEIQENEDHCVHRAFRLRQIHLSENRQPDE